MQIENRTVNTIEEAFALLPDKLQDHCKRVSKYCELAFAQIVEKGFHLDTNKGRVQLTEDNIPYAAIAGLYHDIGKILPDEEEEILFGEADEADLMKEISVEDLEDTDGSNSGSGPKDHTANGMDLVKELYPDFKELTFVGREVILEGIRDHHERLNGFGGPAGKRGESISYMGRIVALADLLDHHAIAAEADSPISQALEDLKDDVKAGFLDEDFYKAFASIKGKLKKVFDESIGTDVIVPKTDTMIKRRVSRPMELVFKTAHLLQTSEDKLENHLWYAEMRFKSGSENKALYKDVAKSIVHNKLGAKLGEYFLYELCDATRRFRDIGLNLGGAAMVLPAAFLTQCKAAADVIETVLGDEDLEKREIFLIIPEELSEKRTKIAEANINECKERGIQLMEEYEFMSVADVEEEMNFESGESIERNQIRALSDRARREARWDAELEASEE